MYTPMTLSYGSWEKYSDIDMVDQGDIEQIKDWKNNHTFHDLMEIVIKKRCRYTYSRLIQSLTIKKNG